MEVRVKTLSPATLVVILTALMMTPAFASADERTITLRDAAFTAGRTQPTAAQAGQQGNVPQPVQQAEDAVERVVERFGIGVFAGVGVDPELITFGAHATFAPIFHPDVAFRPGFDLGVGEVTTSLTINADFIYLLPGSTGNTWGAYIGAGPNFGVSHVGFEAEDEEDRNRFDFSDTDFDGGFNFIAGARRDNGLFLELRATAYGVTNVKLLAGFNF
jgi:hypothetical protein